MGIIEDVSHSTINMKIKKKCDSGPLNIKWTLDFTLFRTAEIPQLLKYSNCLNHLSTACYQEHRASSTD